MSETDLAQAVADLREEIQHLPERDAEARAHLESLLNRLEDKIVEETAAHHQAHEVVPSLIERFEVEHPRLTSVLQRIMVSLGDMGI